MSNKAILPQLEFDKMANAKKQLAKTETNHTSVEPVEGTLVTAVKVSGEHRATFCKDNYTGRWSIRIVGPRANMFAGRIVPVIKGSGDTVHEETGTLSWCGTDDGSVIPSDAGKLVAIYRHVAKPRALDDEIPF
jgi:hypothetical protein